MNEGLTAVAIIEALSRLISVADKDLWVHPYLAELFINGDPKVAVTVFSPQAPGAIQLQHGTRSESRSNAASFTLSEEDFVLLAQRKVSAQELFLRHRLSVSGDEGNVLRANHLFELLSQSIERAL